MANEEEKGIVGIILAAGESKRFGEPKQLLPFNGKPLLMHAVDSALNSKLDEVIIVLGYEANKIKEKLKVISKKSKERLKVVVNLKYNTGRKSSILCGIKAAKKGFGGLMFIQGDQPLISSYLMNRLIFRFLKEKSPLAFPIFGLNPCQPVIFQPLLIKELLDAEENGGGKSLKLKYWSVASKLELNSLESQIDVDTKEDYKRLLELKRYE